MYFILILVLAGFVICAFMVIMVKGKEARPPRVCVTQRAYPSAPIGRIDGPLELCTDTCTDVAGLCRGRLGL